MEVVVAFGAAARRAVEAGADGIQLHAAHGYLISEFLSPFFNIRTDSWGSSDENRFRFLKEIFNEVSGAVPEGYPVLVKINSNDFTPKEGTTPTLAATYGAWLAEFGIDAVEVSCGATNYSYMKWKKSSKISMLILSQCHGRLSGSHFWLIRSRKARWIRFPVSPVIAVWQQYRTIFRFTVIIKSSLYN